MPNWVETNVSISGPADSLRAWAKKSLEGYVIKEGDPQLASARHLGYTGARTEGVGQFTFGALTGVPDDFAHNWYDRSVELWGTKWDVSDVNTGSGFGEDAGPSDLLECVESAIKDPRPDGSVVYSLSWSTAWSPAIPYFDALVAAYPDLVVHATYIDEGDNFVGYAIISADERIVVDLDSESLIPRAEYPEADDDGNVDEAALEAYYEAHMERETLVRDRLEELSWA
jgi:hypothetical protein